MSARLSTSASMSMSLALRKLQRARALHGWARGSSLKSGDRVASLRAALAIVWFVPACVVPMSAYATAMPAATANSAATATSAANANANANANSAATAPAAKSSAGVSGAENATPAAPNGATSNSNAGSAPAAATSSSSPLSPSVQPAQTSAPQTPVTARTPAAMSTPSAAPAAGAKAPVANTMPSTAAGSYSPSPQLRFGGYMVFRNLIPSPVLEAQAAEEFSQITYGAEHANRLYADTDAHVTRVRSIVDKLVPYSLKWNERAKNWKWEVAVIRSPDIRMYCLPGGKIVVYGGLLDRARLNDNELGMLIGHEIAHALREHARERLGQLQSSQLDSSGTIPQLFGLADLGAAPLGIGSRLLEMKYAPTDETEADVIGSDIASRAGFDPRAAVTLWDKLAQATQSNRNQGFIYVHPYTPVRRQDIVKRLPDMLPLYAKAIGKSVDALPDYAGIGRPKRKAPRD